MIRGAAVISCALLLAAGSWAANSTPDAPHAPNAAPPVAKIVPYMMEAHGTQRIDNYHWMRDRTDPAVMSYLKAENAYAASRLEPLKPLIAELDAELRARADGADQSPPFSDSRFIYRRRIAKGASHPQIVRSRIMPDSVEQVVLDIERLAANHPHYDVADFVVSPDGNSVAFAVDFTGGRQHRIFIRNITTGEIADTGISGAAADLVFSTDSEWLFYVRLQPGSARAHQLWRHALGVEGAEAQLLYEETDPTFELNLSRSKSGKYILLNSSHQQSSEVRYLAAERPLEAMRIMEPRRSGVVYDADHVGDTFYVRTNLGAPDFRIMQTPQDGPGAGRWTELIGETPGRLIADFELFDSFIALVEEANANQSVRVYRFADRQLMDVPVPAEIGVAEIGFAKTAGNRNAETSMLRLRFSGPKHPETIYDFDTQTGAMTARKRSSAWTWFRPDSYNVRRISIAARDGEAVPVTLTYRNDLLRKGGNPVLITAYGAYGTSELPTFPETWLSLIDRGFVLAQAHVRGGHEKGARWYDQGRVLNKTNSYNDFIDATEALIAQGHADPRRVFAQGASAGGLLVAVAANRRPDLYAGIVAEVPFVDVINTMSDPTLPLTTLEYDEWGNPAIEQHYRAMQSYSPYDNVTPRPLPPMLVTAALNDSQVGYHEPAKWVARLRAMREDDNEILLMTSMNAGHLGKPGRFGSSKENATIIAWLIERAAKRR